MLLKIFLLGYVAITMVSQAPPAAGGPPRAPIPAVMKHATQARQPRLPVMSRLTSTPRAGLVAPAPNSARPYISVYNGLNKVGLNANDNAVFFTTPPDTTGSIGPNYYVQTVNSVIGVFNRADLSRKTTKQFYQWLHQSIFAALCDPQIQWDDVSQRWLYIVLGCSFGVDKTFYGWSKTSDPSDLLNGWCQFSIPTPGYLSDYPKLGHSAGYMIIGTNDFSDSGGNPFLTAEIFWTPTPAPGDASCTAQPVNSTGHNGATPLKNGDGASLTATPVPVNTIRAATDGYILSAYDPSGPPASTQTKVAIWHVDSAGVLHQDPDVSVNSYTVPNPAPNAGGAFPIDTLDGRLTQAVGDPLLGMFTQHTVGADTNPSTRSRVDWYEITAGGGVTSLTQQGTISSTTDFVFNAAISPTWDFTGAMIEYNRSSSSLTPVIATQTRGRAAAPGTMDSGELLIGTSTDHDHDSSCGATPPPSGFPCRWGDYSGASPDPLNVRLVWGANQTQVPPSGPGGPTAPAWITRIFAIVVTSKAVGQVPPAAPPPRTPPNQSTPAPPPPR